MHVADYIKHIENKLSAELKRQVVRNQYAWWLLEKLTNRSKADLIIEDDLTLSPEQQEQLDEWLHEITDQHKPIAYILGTVPFGPLSIIVKPPVLIPRPETEEWSLELIEQIKATGTDNLTILDLCAGSGCIAFLFAHMLPDARVYATDICADALALAEQNKTALGLQQVIIIESDLFAAIPQHVQFDLIVCNPPYVAPEEYAQLDPSVTEWEHKHALYAADEGLFFIKKIIEQAPAFIRPNNVLQEHGINQLYIEIGWRQGQVVKEIMEHYGYINVMIHKDSAGKDRVVSGSIIPKAILDT